MNGMFDLLSQNNLRAPGDNWHHVQLSDHQNHCCYRSCRDSSSHWGPRFSCQAVQANVHEPILMPPKHVLDQTVLVPMGGQ